MSSCLRPRAAATRTRPTADRPFDRQRRGPTSSCWPARLGRLLRGPKPPAVPIVVGGASDAALRRAVTLGDGWFLPSQPLDDVPEQLGRVRRALDQAGRDPAGFRVFVPCLGVGRERIAALDDPLVSDVVVMPWAHPGKVD